MSCPLKLSLDRFLEGRQSIRAQLMPINWKSIRTVEF